MMCKEPTVTCDLTPHERSLMWTLMERKPSRLSGVEWDAIIFHCQQMEANGFDPAATDELYNFTAGFYSTWDKDMGRFAMHLRQAYYDAVRPLRDFRSPNFRKELVTGTLTKRSIISYFLGNLFKGQVC